MACHVVCVEFHVLGWHPSYFSDYDHAIAYADRMRALDFRVFVYTT